MNRRRLTASLATAAAVWSAPAVARVALDVTPGLSAQYFTNAQRSGEPAFAVVDRSISDTTIRDRWGGDVPPSLSARWFGYLTILDETRPRLFALETSGAASLRIGGQVVIETEANPQVQTYTSSVTLAPGQHFVLIEYARGPGQPGLAWSWGDEPT